MIPNELTCSNAFRDISAFYAHERDIPKALELANRISDAYTRSLALKDICETLTELNLHMIDDIAKATAVANIIPTETIRKEALACISTAKRLYPYVPKALELRDRMSSDEAIWGCRKESRSFLKKTCEFLEDLYTMD
ncbi:MAG TPA: hypothetical protein VHL30_03815 [Chlamydiales bacterium]|jgi:hypothetical protein|nr:hypothetical protein [Chlamydiales bacterium]